MSGKSLLVMVPTRGRRALAERCLKSFTETRALDSTEILFISDPDDDSYDGMDWGIATHVVLDPREYVTGKLNKTAAVMADGYDALMHTGDDNVFVTPGWDAVMLGTLDAMGGSGWVYPDNKRRADVPEMWLCSSDIVQALGWFLCPALQMYYVDNVVAETGKRAGLIRFCPEAVIEHRHYSVDPSAAHDATYREAEDKFGAADLAAFQQWRATQLPMDVAMLRREFSPDLAWVLSKVA